VAGSTTCASSLVWSGTFAKLTTKATLRIASASLRPDGSVNAGLTPGPSTSISISPPAMARASAATSACGVTLPYAESGPKRTVLPTFPAAAFKRLIATWVSVALEPVTATPPPMASPGLAWANAFATCLIVSAATPVVSAAFLRSMPATASPNRLSAMPSSTITRRMASARSPSVPGTLRTHSSAFDAVKDCRGSTWMSVPARPSRNECIRANIRA